MSPTCPGVALPLSTTLLAGRPRTSLLPTAPPTRDFKGLAPDKLVSARPSVRAAPPHVSSLLTTPNPVTMPGTGTPIPYDAVGVVWLGDNNTSHPRGDAALDRAEPAASCPSPCVISSGEDCDAVEGSRSSLIARVNNEAAISPELAPDNLVSARPGVPAAPLRAPSLLSVPNPAVTVPSTGTQVRYDAIGVVLINDNNTRHPRGDVVVHHAEPAPRCPSPCVVSSEEEGDAAEGSGSTLVARADIEAATSPELWDPPLSHSCPPATLACVSPDVGLPVSDGKGPSSPRPQTGQAWSDGSNAVPVFEATRAKRRLRKRVKVTAVPAKLRKPVATKATKEAARPSRCPDKGGQRVAGSALHVALDEFDALFSS